MLPLKTVLGLKIISPRKADLRIDFKLSCAQQSDINLFCSG